MTDTKDRYAKKRLIHVTKEQEERMAQQAHAKVQAYVNELNQIQARRFELATALLIADVTKNGLGVTSQVKDLAVSTARELAAEMVEADAKQKWEGLKALFVELAVPGPQDALEWAAKQVGVTLFDVLPEEPDNLIVEPTIADVAKVAH